MFIHLCPPSSAQVDCTVHDRDYYLYYFLLMYPGRTIIFVNAVSAVRCSLHILMNPPKPCVWFGAGDLMSV